MVQMLNEKPKLQQLTIKPFKRCECEMKPFEEWMNQMNISKTAAMYIVEKDVKSGITTWMYIPEEKKEKKMKETNLQHYKEELKKMFNENYTKPGNIVFKIKKEIDESIETDCYYSSYTNDILDWMARPYEEKILDDVEKEYLSAVIKPFRNRVKYIVKTYGVSEARQFIKIIMCDGGYSNLPFFKEGTMYNGMKVDKQYTLQELGL